MREVYVCAPQIGGLPATVALRSKSRTFPVGRRFDPECEICHTLVQYRAADADSSRICAKTGCTALLMRIAFSAAVTSGLAQSGNTPVRSDLTLMWFPSGRATLARISVAFETSNVELTLIQAAMSKLQRDKQQIESAFTSKPEMVRL